MTKHRNGWKFAFLTLLSLLLLGLLGSYVLFMSETQPLSASPKEKEVSSSLQALPVHTHLEVDDLLALIEEAHPGLDIQRQENQLLLRGQSVIMNRIVTYSVGLIPLTNEKKNLCFDMSHFKIGDLEIPLQVYWPAVKGYFSQDKFLHATSVPGRLELRLTDLSVKGAVLKDCQIDWENNQVLLDLELPHPNLSK